MKPNLEFSKLASEESIQKVIKALQENGITAQVVGTEEEARKKTLSMIPENSEVFSLSSITLEQTGIAKEINESGKFDSVRNKLNSMDRNTQGREMAKLGTAPQYAVGSVHAVTEDGHLLIASKTGSQLSSEAFGAEKVIFIIGTQKIVKDANEGIKRIDEYSLPLENERAQKAYGMASSVDKVLIIYKEIFPNRIHVVLVKKNLGF